MKGFFVLFLALSSSAIRALAQERSGESTYYDVEVGLTACGTSHKKTELVAATAFSLWTTPNPNLDPMCKKTATVKNLRNGKTITVNIKDKCFACKPNDLDLTETAFKALGEDLKKGRFKISWHLN